ncbi:MAG: hypothetical protein ACRERC_24955 [Candidatus Binatia bacterium]
MGTASAIAPPLQLPAIAWLYGRNFDLGFTVGLAAVSVLAGASAQANPAWFAPLFFLNMWGLGFPHVVATFTRIAFDKASFAEHRFLTVGLPPLIFLAVVGLGISQGQWLLATIYLYWQAFHYTRQSYGIAQAYARRAENAPHVNQRLSRWVLYAIPLWGMMYRSFQAPASFLGLDVWFVPVPELAVRLVGIASAALIVVWCVEQLRLARSGRLPLSHFLYMASHIAVFVTGYLLVDSLDVGWLMVNIWHNAQYLLFIWYFQTKRFGGRVDPERRLLSQLSLPRNAVWFFATCLLISTVAYNAFFQLSSIIPLQPVTLAFLIGQTINYHHYIVDAVVWRRPAVARALAPPAG